MKNEVNIDEIHALEVELRTVGARMAGAMHAWKDCELLPEFIRESCRELNAEDERVRGALATAVDRACRQASK